MMKGIKCKNCKNLINDWCDVKCDSPDPALVRDCIGFEQGTNGDRIRAMSDEELAELLEGTNTNTAIKLCGEYIVRAKEYIEIWLKQPAEVDR